ncbi:MAG: aminodeoxychorismate synthase component I [Leptolyngbyaceae cyanobacterium SM1_3_5]|nr:aminodeoxychorismate synthase component I [Leptolyngbyaceae cyanobacterium SM1_3_5]
MKLRLTAELIAPSINSVVLQDADRQQWLYFQNPIEILTTTYVAEVIPLLEKVQQFVDRGYYAAGFLSYEAAPAFDSSFKVISCKKFPLVWFGIYADFNVVTLPEIDDRSFISLNWKPSISREEYGKAIAKIKSYIAQGLTYQVNFSFRLQAQFLADPWNYFLQLIQAQNCQYGAFISLENWAICSASPELFFQQNRSNSQAQIICRPMKGTLARGLAGNDRHLANALRNSEKNQAENLMIVDMIRNDLGRIAEIGSVQVPQLFNVEQYPTLWQMTSSVQCLTQADFVEMWRSLFPCASITGAPKSSTMQIIAELEESSRRIYTGTIGYFTPEKTAQFNVAIRTVLIDRIQKTAEYGVGGGIVWDSIEADEYDECCTKAKVLAQPQFELLETLLWTPSEYFLLDFHLQRLQTSASYFAFKVDIDRVRDRLLSTIQTLPPLPHKVRLRVSNQGKTQIETAILTDDELGQSLQVALADSPVNSADIFLYHKTTNRSIYKQMKQQYLNFDEVLLWNEKGELTEFCTGNLVVELDNKWYTPPLACGLLAGTYRRYLLQRGKVQERIIRREELHDCSRIFLINSVRQMCEAIVQECSIANHS